MGKKSISGTGNHQLPGQSKRGLAGHEVVENEEFFAEEQSRRAKGERLFSEELEERKENFQMFGSDDE